VPGDFDIVDAPLPEPKEGEVLLRGIYLSLDPYMRGRISGVRSYARPTEIGDVIEGRVVGQVMRSNHPDFRDGDYAAGGYGWQLYSAAPGNGLLKLDPAEAPISTALGILGMPGMTAYIGLSDIGQPKAGETIVVSAASGAVGAVAGQLAKRQGRRHRRRRRQMPLRQGRARLRCGARPSRPRSRRRARRGLPERHRRLFRECRRRGAAGGVPAPQ
jgi:NADPH-dependent curcumin reductase CurA